MSRLKSCLASQYIHAVYPDAMLVTLGSSKLGDALTASPVGLVRVNLIRA